MSTNYSGRTLTAMYDNRAEADRAASDLRALGITDVTLHGEDNPGYGRVETRREEGFWDSLSNLFFPEEDRAYYAEGLSRGGFLLTAQNVPEDMVAHARDILDREGSVDMDRRGQEWTQSGWSAEAGAAAYRGKTDTHTDAKIDIVEEQMNVGKREVDGGTVRVRSYVREVPVEKDVQLTDENVSVERRAVDRPADGHDFEDKVLEATEKSERAVVDKEARVVEEVTLDKTSDTRTETVRDTVRKTEVDIDKS